MNLLRKRKRNAHEQRCRDCGYRMLHLHRDDCPMCRTCQWCGKILMICRCHEGE